MTKLTRCAIAAVLVLLISAGVAYADATIYAGPPNSFYQGDVSIAQGDSVTFTNGDTVDHDVTAVAKGADGKPLFASAKTGTGQSNTVEGVQYLTSGSYDYICSIHPFMKGTITVTTAGTPKPRPGASGNGNGQQAPGTSADTTPPTLVLKVLDTKKSQVRKRRSLQLRIGTNEPGTLSVSATSGQTVVARGTFKFVHGQTKKVSVKLTKAGLKLTKKSKSVPITVNLEGTDKAGNKATGQATGTLR